MVNSPGRVASIPMEASYLPPSPMQRGRGRGAHEMDKGRGLMGHGMDKGRD